MIARRVVGVVVVVVVVCCSAAACFDPAIPDDVPLLCASDGDCPAGQRCDARLCLDDDVVVDRQAPTLLSAEMVPAVARAGDTVRLQLTADEDLDVVDGFVFAGGADPVLVVDALEGASATVVLPVDAGADDGFLTLLAVDLVDAAGNRATSPARAVLAIDGTAPTLTALRVADGSDDGLDVFADADAFDDIFVDVRVSEPVVASGVRASVGAAALACVVDGLAIGCSGVIDGNAVVDGVNNVVVSVTDEAGNAASASASAVVDLDDPGVVGVPRVRVNDRDASAAATGDTVEIEFLVDEPLAGLPVVRVDTGQALVFDQVVRDGQFFTARLQLPTVRPESDGVHRVLATLVDRFGHSAEVTLRDDITLASFPLSPCPDGPCADVDGDGFLGVTVACARSALSDCDDGDPRTFPGAPQLAFDGKDNACVDGGGAGGPRDDVLDDNAAVFVDPGFTGNPQGTRNAPFTDVIAAAAAADERGVALVVAAGDVVAAALDGRDGDFYGGLDRDFGGFVGRTHLLGSPSLAVGPPTATAPVVVAGVDGGAWTFLRPGAVYDVGGDLNANDPVVVDRSELGLVFLDAGVAASHFTGVTIGSALTLLSGTVVVDRGRFAGQVSVLSGAHFTASNTIFSGGFETVCNGCSLDIAHSTIALTSTTLVRITNNVIGVTPRLRIARSILVPTPGATLLALDIHPTPFTFVNNVLVPAAGSSIDDINDNTEDGLDDFEGCIGIGCDDVQDNVVGDVDFALGDFAHLAGGAAVDALEDDWGDDASAADLADVDGDCRALTGGDVGPDRL